MSDIPEKMRNKVPHRFFRLNIFLSAHMAIPALHPGLAIQAVLFFPFLKTAHAL